MVAAHAAVAQVHLTQTEVSQQDVQDEARAEPDTYRVAVIVVVRGRAVVDLGAPVERSVFG